MHHAVILYINNSFACNPADRQKINAAAAAASLWHLSVAKLQQCIWAEALVLWLKVPAWKIGDRRLELHSGLQVSKKQNVSSPLTRKDSIL